MSTGTREEVRSATTMLKMTTIVEPERKKKVGKGRGQGQSVEAKAGRRQEWGVTLRYAPSSFSRVCWYVRTRLQEKMMLRAGGGAERWRRRRRERRRRKRVLQAIGECRGDKGGQYLMPIAMTKGIHPPAMTP